MSNFELTLKQFTLLSGMSMILVQPSLGAGVTQASSATEGFSAQPEQTIVLSSKQKKHSKSSDEKFVFRFSVPYLPAIED